MNKQIPVTLIRLNSMLFGDGNWVLFNMNTEEVLARGRDKILLQKIAKEKGYQIKVILNDYN